MRSILVPLVLVFAASLTACGDGETGTVDTTTTEDTTQSSPASTGENPGDSTASEPATSTGDPVTTGVTTGATTGTTDPTGASTGGSEATGDPTTGVTTGDTTTGDPSAGESTDDSGAAQELPPIESAEVLEAWLVQGSYKTWAAETGVHPSTGPHGGNVRTFVNDVALASLDAQNAEHPMDSATVKELYGNSMDEIIGYAVSLKTAPESQGGGTWYWYERVNATIYADDLGVGLCTGCHGGGADYILTPYPLQ